MSDIQIKIAAIITEDDSILLIKERNTEDNKYYWNLITGTFDASKDKSLLDTVIRECREEANTEIKIENLINMIYYRKNDKIRLQFGFFCKGNVKESFLNSVQEQDSRNEDIIEIKLFTKEELAKIKLQDFMNERAYETLTDFLEGKSNDISIIKEIIKL